MNDCSIVQLNCPYDYQKLCLHLLWLGERYDVIHTETVGSSVMGKSIHAVRLGTGPVHLHYNGAFHANEWITSMLLMKFIEQCAEALSGKNNALTRLHKGSVQDVFKRISLWVVPMVNPDGVDLSIHGLDPLHPHYWQLKEWNKGSELFSHWKANIRGVDLNDQFPAHWEVEVMRRDVSGPGPRDYPGNAPLSEPEAKAMAEFTRKQDFQAVFAFHTQGEEIYWNYRGYEPEQARPLAERLARASGYAAIELTGSDAGYKDWFIQEFGRPGFTIEAGYGENPLPLSTAVLVYNKLLPLMVEGLTLCLDE